MNGSLLSETSPTGQTTNYGFDTSGRLATVTDAFGHTLTFGYNTDNHISTVTDSAGKVISYSYDANNNLTRVDYPDATAKLYHYENTSFPNYLTGISYVDAGGVVTRYATYAYDTNGKAITTQHAQTDNGAPQEKFTLAYDTDTQTTVTDPVNMQEVMTFSTNLGVKNLVSKTTSIDTNSLQQTFDANNNLACRKDEENRVTLYSYNSTNQRASMTEGLSGTDCNACIANPANCNGGGIGRVTTYDYLSPTLDLPRFIRRPSVATGQTFETEIVYGDAGHPNLPTQIIQRGFTPSNASVSRTVTLVYNAFGQVNSINGPRTDVNDVTTLEYYECTTGGACGQLKKVTNALGHITTYDLYDANGRLLQMTDPNALRTSYTYDARGRVKTITQTPTSGSAALWQYSYTPWGDVSQVIDPDGVMLNYQYDAAHYLRYIVDNAGNYLYYTYDLKGNRTGENVYDSSSNLMRTLSKAYDLRDHLSSITSAGNITQLVHDAVGNLAQQTDGNNFTTTHGYDALNRLLQTVDALGGITGYGHDANDRPTSVSAPNNLATNYEYDDLGNLLQEVSPDRGITAYTYDTAGNVLTLTDARGKPVSYAYDALNRVISQQSAKANTPRYTYIYDTCGRGRLCRIQQNAAAHLDFSYDGLGRLSNQASATGLASVYAYTPGGRLMQVTYPSGRTVDYTYDTLGQVSQVSTTANSVTTVLANNIQHYPFGPVYNLSYGNARGLWAYRDTAYRPTFRFDAWYGVYDTYYDGADNVLATTGDKTLTFGYDPVNRLTAANDPRRGSYGSLSYLYDGNGNRTAETRNGTSTPYAYYPEGSNWLFSAGNEVRLTDPAGNTTYISALGFLAYDGYGRMTSALSGAAVYDYSAFNQRIKKTYNNATTNTFHYGPQGELLYETDGTNTRAYAYLDGVPLARVDNNTQIYYYHTDHLGTPQLMTNGSGTTVWKATYEPFGKATITVSTITNNVRYAGQHFDQETQLLYNGARYRDPKTNRFLTADPVSVGEHVQNWLIDLRALSRRGRSKGLLDDGFAQASMIDRPPLELNPYAAVANNPLRWIDPTGESATGTLEWCITHPAACGDAAAAAGSAAGAAAIAGAGALLYPPTLCEGEDDQIRRCEANLERDLETCRALGRRNGKAAYKICERQAMERYGNCLAGRNIQPPLPPWDTK